MVVDLPSLALFLAPFLLLLGPHQVHGSVQQHLGQGGDRAILKHMKRRTSIQGTKYQYQRYHLVGRLTSAVGK